MSGLKRPYHDDGRATSAGSPAFAGKRKLISTSEVVRSKTASAASLWTTAALGRYNNHNTFYDDTTQPHEPSPAPWLSSPSSGDSYEAPSSTESTWTPFTNTSNTEASRNRNESSEIEICFGMVGL